MDSYSNLFKKSFFIAYSHKSMCLLGLMQISALIFALRNINLFWSFFALVIFASTTIFLWLRIQALVLEKNFKIDFKILMQTFLRFLLFTFSLFVVSVTLQFIGLNWNYYVIVMSALGLTLMFASLACVLFNLRMVKSIGFAFDFIGHKSNLFFNLYLILIFTNSISYYFSHLLANNGLNMGGFSVFNASATIWLVFLGILLSLALVVGVVNVFLVLLFLNISKIIPSSPEVKTTLLQAQAH